MMAVASAECSISCIVKLSMGSSRSVVRRKLGKSLSLMCLLIPRAQPTGVSRNPFVSCSASGHAYAQTRYKI
jgi:hypothetical protein